MNEAGQKPPLKVLPQQKDRISFLYIEKSYISRDQNALLIQDEKGKILVPSAQFSVLLIGPGVNLTHRAIELAVESGVTIIWTGEFGVRFYASGRALSNNSRLLVKQAEAVSNRNKHLNIVRKMYKLRFPDENVDGLTLQQLRGKEGSRVKKAYKEASKKWNVE